MKRPLSLEGSASEIYLRAADVIETMIEDIVDKKPDPKPQQGEPVVFHRRTPEQSGLCEAQIFNLNDLFNHIRMLDAEGYPKAFVDLHGHRVEFAQVTMENNKLFGTFEIHPKNKKT
jgi:methionyl-tRNA formyltransferase